MPSIKSTIPSILCIFLGLLTTEALVRLFPSFFNTTVINHEIYNHVWAPDTYFVHKEFRNSGIPEYTRKSNSLGWLSKQDYTTDKSPDEYRFFFLGDSFTEGTVPEEYSVPAIVQQQLSNHINQHSKKLHAINVGTQSYSPLLHYLRLKHEIIHYKPDAIMLNIDMTDVFDDFLYRQNTQRNVSGEITRSPPHGTFELHYKRVQYGLRRAFWFEKILSSGAGYSRMISILSIYTSALHADRAPLNEMPKLFDWCSEPWSRSTTESVEFTKSYITKIIQFAHSHGIKVFVTGIPHRQQLEGQWSTKPLEIIEEAATESHAQYFNLYANLRIGLNGREPQSIYIPGDMHFNLDGYTLWGKMLSNWLETKIP